MQWYFETVRAWPLPAAFVQFLVLGTLGEALGALVAGRKPGGSALEWVLKAIVWGFLGILVKYAFAGFAGFLDAIAHKGFLPAACVEWPLLRAFCLSLLTNAMFGPYLMLLHRTTDNAITRTKGYAGIEKSLWTLAWFWLPAHTVTFVLPPDYQIGLAAAWSIALGVIMGFTKRHANSRSSS